MKTWKTTATITVIAATGIALLAGCDTFQHLIAGNEDAVAGTVDGAGNVGGTLLTTLLPPPFNILAASAVTGLAAWFSAKVRGYKQGVTELKGVVSAGRLSDPAFDSSFDATAAATAMRVALANNPALAKAFNKS